MLPIRAGCSASLRALPIAPGIAGLTAAAVPEVGAVPEVEAAAVSAQHRRPPPDPCRGVSRDCVGVHAVRFNFSLNPNEFRNFLTINGGRPDGVPLGNSEAGSDSRNRNENKPTDCPAFTGGVQVAAAFPLGGNGSADVFFDIFNGSIGTTAGIGPSGGFGGFITAGVGVTSRSQLNGDGRDFSALTGYGLAGGVTAGSRGGVRGGFGIGGVLNVTRNSTFGGNFEFPGLTEIPYAGGVIAAIFCSDPN